MWALPEGRLVHTLTTQDRGTVLAVALSPDGRTLAAASAYVVSLWDTESGRLLRQLAGHQDTVETIAFRPDGKEIASGGSDATIRQWNVQDGTLKRVLSRRSPGVSITSVALSQDGGLEALGTANGLVRVWNTRGGDLAYDLVGHEGAVQALGVTPDGVWLCSGSADRTLRVWRLANGALSTTYPNFDRGDGMGVLAIGGGNGWVATAAGPWGDGTVNPVIKLWPVMFDRPIHLLRGHRAAVRSVAFRPGSDLLASADEAGTVKLWNSRTAECLRSVTSATPAQTLAFSPGGQWLVAGMADGRVRVLETNTLSTAREWHAHQRPALGDVSPMLDQLRPIADPSTLDPFDILGWANLPAVQLLEKLVNDLELAAFAIEPRLSGLRQKIESRIGRPVRMSGSGSTLFTLFDDIDHAKSAADSLQTAFSMRTEAVELGRATIRELEN